MPGITFDVDAVTPRRERPPAVDNAISTVIDGAPIAHSDGLGDLIAVADRPGLLLAVELAYKEHRPLEIAPDDVWLTIAQGFARHVTGNAERLRDRFVRHQGKKVLRITADAMTTRDSWEHALDAFASEMEPEIGGGLVRLMTCSFSTTTPASHTASRIVLLDAFKKYFDYEIVCICGIPQVRLLGTPDDWRDIRTRLDVLAEYDLAWWIDPLRPIADQWIATSEGKPDREFWQHLYSSQEFYGDDCVHGWISRLYPYYDSEGSMPIRQDSFKGPRSPTFTQKAAAMLGFGKPNEAERRWLSTGFAAKSVTGGLSRVPIRCVGVGGDRICVAIAGLFGVGLGEDGFVRARAGWAVREDPISALYDRIASRHRLHARTGTRPRADSVPAHLVALYDVGDGATFHGGHVVIRSASKLESRHGTQGWGTVFGDLDDGALLVWGSEPGSHTKRILLERNGVANVVANTVLELLQRLTDEATCFL